MQVAPLVELAASISGGYRNLARELGVPDSVLHHYRTGTRSCPVDIQAMMADIAGFNATEQVKEVLIAKHEGTPRGERLKRALARIMTDDVPRLRREMAAELKS